MTTDKRGLSALLPQRQLGLSRYETAWRMLHKFRRAMINLKREPLRGDVEVDDTWVGGTQAGLRGSRPRKGRKAALVLVAVENRGHSTTGRARMAVIPDFRKETLLGFLKDNVEPGSRIHRRTEELYWVERSWLSARVSQPTAPNGPAERREVRSASGRQGHWQSPAVAVGYSSRCESRSTPGLPG